MGAKPKLRIGVKAPDFAIETSGGRFSLHECAAQHETLVLTTQDSYRYHPN